MSNQRFGLNAATLRILAMAFMLLDHLWATVIPGNDWMNYIGRLAFPIFAFQTVEGYLHTRDFRRYCLRLLLFGLVSEIPFNLMVSGSLVYPFHQNVMFTLLLGLLTLRRLDAIQKNAGSLKGVKDIVLLTAVLLAAIVTLPDYGVLGVATVAAFYLLRGFPGAKPAQLLAMAAIHCLGYEGQTIPLFDGAIYFPVQGFAVLSLIPIWLYSGEKGPGGRVFQYAAYAFYPVHMLILGCMQYL